MIWGLLFIGFSILMTVPVPAKPPYKSVGIEDVLDLLVFAGFLGTLVMTLIKAI